MKEEMRKEMGHSRRSKSELSERKSCEGEQYYRFPENLGKIKYLAINFSISVMKTPA